MKTSALPLASPGTRLAATLAKLTTVPSWLIAGSPEAPMACTPDELTLTRVVVPAWRSRRKTSEVPLVSPGTRLLADDWNATKRPSPLIAGAGSWELPALPWAPAELTLTREDAGLWRSRTNTSVVALVSPATRSVATEE